MQELFQQESAIAICAVSGMGGIGKTELAFQYALKHRDLRTYPGGICWIRARQEVKTQIVEFARSRLELIPPDDYEIDAKVRWCWEHWRKGEALIVFDDVQNYQEIESSLPPARSRFNVLLTTRLRLGRSFRELDLEVLTEPAALQLLRAIVQDERIDQELERSKQLCEWLGYLPLGVEMVGRYLFKKRDLLIEELWQRLQEKRLETRAFKQAEPGMTASLGVAAAFELSWQALEESAQQVAAVLSLFALVEIPWAMVEQCLPEMDAEELEEIRDQVLLGSNLLKRVDQGMYQLHQLLKEFFAAKRRQQADAEELHRKFYEAVIAEAERVKKKPERSIIQESTVTIAHLQSAMEQLARPGQALDLATCLHWIANFYYAKGRYIEAEPLFVRSLSIREEQLGGEHPDVAQSLSGLALLYFLQGRNEEAEPLYLQSIEIRQRQFGQDHPDVAQSLNNLALLYYSQGQYEEAEPLLLRSLEIWQRQFGQDYPDVALSLHNLALLYYSQGQYEEAESLYLQSLEIGQRQLGQDHPNVAHSLNNLARLYCSQARYSDAEPLLLRALSILQNQLPVEHPLTARVVSSLAHFYSLQGHYCEAESLYLQSLSILSAKVGENHLWRREASRNFRSLLQKALQENRTDELSAHPTTRSLLQQLQDEES